MDALEMQQTGYDIVISYPREGVVTGGSHGSGERRDASSRSGFWTGLQVLTCSASTSGRRST